MHQLIKTITEVALRRNISNIDALAQEIVAGLDTVKTEDTGKIFEMAICLAYKTQYSGQFKYSMGGTDPLIERLSFLKTKLPFLIHTAKGGSRYDFACGDRHLSAKTTKKQGMVAPQYLGQQSPTSFCQRAGIPIMETPELKHYIQEHICELLPLFEKYTFESPIVYWDKHKDTLRYIEKSSHIPWTTFEYTWTQPASTWNSSSSLKIGNVTILEVQFHTRRRNMAIRWCFENVLKLFADQITVEFF